MRPVAFDAADTLEPTSRFVIVDGHDIAGCGIALEALEDRGRGDVTGRRFRRGEVTEQARAARYGHAGKAIVFVAESGEAAHEIAARVERSIFARGVHSYSLAPLTSATPRTCSTARRTSPASERSPGR